MIQCTSPTAQVQRSVPVVFVWISCALPYTSIMFCGFGALSESLPKVLHAGVMLCIVGETHQCKKGALVSIGTHNLNFASRETTLSIQNLEQAGANKYSQ